MTKDQFIATLSKEELRELKGGRSEVVECANCGAFTYYGSMNLVALGIQNHKPVCSYECNKKLGQVK